MYPNGINNNDLQNIIDKYENRIFQEKSNGITKQLYLFLYIHVIIV